MVSWLGFVLFLASIPVTVSVGYFANMFGDWLEDRVANKNSTKAMFDALDAGRNEIRQNNAIRLGVLKARIARRGQPS